MCPEQASAPPDGDSGDGVVSTLVAHLGSAMIATGQPVNEVEEELVEIGARWGFRGIQVGAAPTGLIVALHSGGPATYESVTAPVRLDQAVEVRRIRHQLAFGDLDPPTALAQLSVLRGQPPRYAAWLTHTAWILISVGIAMVLQPGWPNIAIVAASALVVLLLLFLARRFQMLNTLLPTLAAFFVSLVVFWAAHIGLIEGPLRTVLPPLAVLLPGALMVTGMTELAAGHMQAGSARLAYGLVKLGLFALGVIAATALLTIPSTMLVNERVDSIGWWALPVGLLLITFGIAFMESVPMSMTPWVLLVLLMAGGAQWLGHLWDSAALGGFLGAMAATLGATFVELLRPQLARLVLFLPAFWLLVPGSLGLIGVTQLVADQGEVAQTVLDVVGVVCAIALGLLVGSSIGLALRNRLRPAPALP
ncbi:MAG: threonine/serine exporter family protein [Ornithinimicrobium sp.]